ncbi:c-type cytochrome [Novosphingobium cyanobacteriorum]|uniref:C-type cytochrome n=1 Tax=Novosphingobium cyanobacteriorum TaxID=3024215 RepID=A0ABT6CG46_9SPHN|nr:c-type cytochrome [Novosphingobium cyanobacteriorum]MDF8332900.1 c-type cytochrome [Novosphingobium cyanobacteriorum]
MTKRMRFALAGFLISALAACGESGTGQGEETGQSAGSTPTAAANAAPPAFGICKSCHAIEPGKTLIGPSLAGIYGAKAGDMQGYQASPALKAANLTWDEATLDKWLANPMALVPGTRMTYAGQTDPAKRQQIIAYLKTLK